MDFLKNNDQNLADYDTFHHQTAKVCLKLLSHCNKLVLNLVIGTENFDEKKIFKKGWLSL